jgi:hypothetical protein
MPHFMAYPSTTTLIAAIILFLNGVIMLNYHNRHAIMLPMYMMAVFIAIVGLIEWKRFFASLQMHAPMNIWSAPLWIAM